MIIVSFLTFLANVKIPVPENQEEGDSKGSLHFYLAIGAVVILVICILFFVGFTRHKLRKGIKPSVNDIELDVERSTGPFHGNVRDLSSGLF